MIFPLLTLQDSRRIALHVFASDAQSGAEDLAAAWRRGDPCRQDQALLHYSTAQCSNSCHPNSRNRWLDTPHPPSSMRICMLIAMCPRTCLVQMRQWSPSAHAPGPGREEMVYHCTGQRSAVPYRECTRAHFVSPRASGLCTCNRRPTLGSRLATGIGVSVHCSVGYSTAQ